MPLPPAAVSKLPTENKLIRSRISIDFSRRGSESDANDRFLAPAGRGNLSNNPLRTDLLQRHLLYPGRRGLEAFDHFGGRVLHAAEDVGWRIGQASGDFGRRGDGGEFFG